MYSKQGHDEPMLILNINIVNSIFSIICPQIEADVFQEKPVPLHDSLQSFPFFVGSVLPAEVVLPGFVFSDKIE